MSFLTTVGRLFGIPKEFVAPVPRSPSWPAVRRKFLAGKSCAACGRLGDLEAHHCIPFHVAPDRELDQTNLIALCRDCHFYVGHLRDWSSYNRWVVDDAARLLERFRTKP